MKRLSTLLLAAAVALLTSCGKPVIYCASDRDNDLATLLESEGYRLNYYASATEAIDAAPEKGAVLLLSKEYPAQGQALTAAMMERIDRKGLRVYAEFCSEIAGVKTESQPVELNLERAVLTDSLSPDLPELGLLTLNKSFFLPAEQAAPLMVTARVAGLDKAEYGLDNTPVQPLLFRLNDRVWIATSKLSGFASGRFAPEKRWKSLWEYLVGHLTEAPRTRFSKWPAAVHPAYPGDGRLPADARRESIAKGIEWYYNGHFLVDSTWRTAWYEKYQGDGTMPVGPELPADAENGDGSLGVLEGHCSAIYADGRQAYRYWLRNDVQGESTLAFAVAGKLLNRPDYLAVSKRLVDFSFDTFRDGPRNDPKSPSFGLLGWSTTHRGTYYGDDNARSILGMIGSAALQNDPQWNRKITEAILANFRTTGRNGFRDNSLLESDLQQNGWKYYRDRTGVSPHPHFESWMWACYLWLYDKTKYEPLLDLSERAIRTTMAAYPERWKWTNGIQQERARMVLPLAWLVRVSPTDEHKQWLDTMVNELLKNQVACGAIREELGDASSGLFGKTRSNAEYGLHEAPLIFENGDPVADMLYTSNFAFFALNEAARATGNPQYGAAVEKLSDFLTRIQVRSDRFKNVDGAWFRAFNYQNWDYWASNADAGWGALSTLTGWIQSWIIGTQGFLEMESSLWEISQNSSIGEVMTAVRQDMLEE